MSIEQTSQLISLILNSVLMTLLSAAMLGGAWLRQNGLGLQLQQVQKQYRRLTYQQSSDQTRNAQPTQTRNQLKAQLKKVRDQRQRLMRQYRWSYIGMLLLHTVLLVFGISLLALSLRSLFLIDGLISTALVLFALGVTGLIVGTTCLFIDISQGNSGSDTLSYSLAKILAQLVRQLSQPFSRRWQRGGRFAQKLTTLPSLKPLTQSMPTPSKKLSGSIQQPDSLTNY